jgi:hypothetical protein
VNGIPEPPDRAEEIADLRLRIERVARGLESTDEA